MASSLRRKQRTCVSSAACRARETVNVRSLDVGTDIENDHVQLALSVALHPAEAADYHGTFEFVAGRVA